MRMIGTLPNEGDARKLADYLLTLDITSRIDQSKDGWIVWVHREERVEQAKREFAAFVANPADAKYQGVEQAARALRRKAQQREKEHERNTIVMSGRRNYRPLERCPLMWGLIGASVVVAVLTNLGEADNAIENLLYITEVRHVRMVVPGETNGDQTMGRVVWVPEWNDLDAVKHGQVWRLITPIFLHFGIMHLFFNMYALYDVGGMVELRRGTWRLAALTLVLAVASNLGQYYFVGRPEFGPLSSHTPLFGGMSGVLYGLFGYAWMQGRYAPERGLVLRPSTVTVMMLWFLICLAGRNSGIANGAHAVGLAAGMLIGFVPHVGDELRRW